MAAHQGAVGAARSVGSSIARLFHKPELWLIKCTILASIISVVYYSGEKAKDDATQAILILIGIAAVGFHYIGAQKACRAWFERQPLVLCGWCLIIAGAIAWEINGQINIASQNQANLTNAALTSHSKSDNASKAVADAEEKLERLKSERNLMKPVRSLPAARAAVESAKAHKRWTATDECRSPKGATTRKWCDDYRSAAADVDLWAEIAKQEIALGAAETDLADARKASLQVGMVASADRADLKTLHRVSGLSYDDLDTMQSMLVVIVLALFLTVAGWMVKAEEYEGKPLKPWINWGRIYRAVFGGEEPRVSHETQAQNGTHTIVERVTENMGALEVLAAYRRPRIA